MNDALGKPSVDPHGEPIPSETGQLPNLTDTPLALLHPNQAATVARVGNENGEFLRYLGGLGLYPDVVVSVLDVAPFDGLVTIEIGGKRGAIGRKAAEQVFVVDVHPAVFRPSLRDS
jgi:DtxR family Mn-dependent transcriptional regulator